MGDRREKVIQSIRTISVSVTGSAGVVILILFTVLHLRANIAKGDTVENLMALLLTWLLIGGIIIGVLCFAVFHALTFQRSTSLKKAVRLVEAMQMLGEHTHKERLEAIRHYSIRIFSTKNELPPGIAEDIPCKEMPTFLSPMFCSVDRLQAIGSPYYCCDFEEIQGIIDDNKTKWCTFKKDTGNTAANITALERKIDDLNDKYQKRTHEYTAASGREGRLKRQMEEVENHMAVLVALASKVSNEVIPPKTVTEEQIKAKYLSIGKIHGITNAPGAYVDIFRKNMPRDIINWGGAPTQGTGKE
jgi:hypothetical protein